MMMPAWLRPFVGRYLRAAAAERVECALFAVDRARDFRREADELSARADRLDPPKTPSVPETPRQPQGP